MSFLQERCDPVYIARQDVHDVFLGGKGLEALGEALDKLERAVETRSAKKIRNEAPLGYCPCADLVDPDESA